MVQTPARAERCRKSRVWRENPMPHLCSFDKFITLCTHDWSCRRIRLGLTLLRIRDSADPQVHINSEKELHQ